MLLRSCGLVRALGVLNLKTMLARATGRRFRDGAPVFQRQEPGNSLFLVMRGEVRLLSREGGESVEPGAARKGDVFGEGGLVEGLAARESSAIAIGELDVVELDPQSLAASMAASPEVMTYLRGIRARRQSASTEMADFLKRW